MGQIRLNFWLPADVEEMLGAYKERTGVGLSALVRLVVSDWVDNTVRLRGGVDRQSGRRSGIWIHPRLYDALGERARDVPGLTKGGAVACLLRKYLKTRMGDS